MSDDVHANGIDDGVTVVTKNPGRKPQISFAPPDELHYAQPAWVIGRRKGAWWLARPFSTYYKEKPDWLGPYETLNAAALALAQRIVGDVANRHAVKITSYKLSKDHPLHGMRATPKKTRRKQQ